MTRSLRVGALLLSALLPAGSAVADDFPPMDDYAYGFPIVTNEAADYYEVALPLSLYESVADPRLRDLGVYDRQGRAVPRFVEPPAPAPEPEELEIGLLSFPLPRNEPRTPDEIRVLLQSGRDGALVALESTGPGSGDERSLDAPPPGSYILDLRDEERPLDAIELDWTSEEPSFVGQVRVDGSADLVSWTSVGRGAVAQLTDGGASITTDRIELSGGRFDFLRITWSGLPEDWSLDAAVGIVRAEAAPIEREWLALEGRFDPEHGIVFDAAAAPWVDRVELVLPGGNVVARASLYVESEATGDWARVYEGTFYRWRRGETSVSGPVAAIDGRRARRWRLVVDKGSPDLKIDLRLGWRPDTLAFVAQGESPYTLAAGRAADGAEGFPQVAAFADTTLLSVIRDTGQGASARLGDRRDLGGPSRLELERRTPWTTLLLWVLLAAGVALVGWMAWRLLRQLDAAG